MKVASPTTFQATFARFSSELYNSGSNEHPAFLRIASCLLFHVCPCWETLHRSWVSWVQVCASFQNRHVWHSWNIGGEPVRASKVWIKGKKIEANSKKTCRGHFPMKIWWKIKNAKYSESMAIKLSTSRSRGCTSTSAPSMSWPWACVVCSRLRTVNRG